MPTLDYAGINLQRHINSGDEFLIGEATYWGDPVIPDGKNWVDLTTQARSISALAIGPESDIDRVQVQYGLPALAAGGATGDPPGQVTTNLIMSTKAPFLSTLRGGKPVVSSNSTVIVLASVDSFGGSYQKEGTPPGNTVFGADMPYLGVFYSPTLQVVLSTGLTKLPATWGRRNPKVVGVSRNFDAIGNDNESPYVVMPIYGRKHIAIAFRANGAASSFDVRASLLTHGFGSGLIETQVQPGVYPAVSTMAGGDALRYDINNFTRADYLIVYATRTAGAGASDSLHVGVQATDD